MRVIIYDNITLYRVLQIIHSYNFSYGYILQVRVTYVRFFLFLVKYSTFVFVEITNFLSKNTFISIYYIVILYNKFLTN